jgi:hypothetical protein
MADTADKMERTSPRKRRIRNLLWWLPIPLLLWPTIQCGVYPHRLTSTETYRNDGKIDTITMFPKFSRVVAAGYWGGLLLLGANGVCGLFRKKGALAVVSFLSAIFCVGWVFSSWSSQPLEDPSWRVYGQVRGQDGQDYYFLLSRGHRVGMAIATPISIDSSAWAFQVKVTNSEDSWCDGSWATVVRPAVTEHDYGRIYLSPNGIVYGFRFDNKCYLAYDPRSGSASGHGDIEATSPFVLIGPNTTVHPGDAAELMNLRNEIGQKPSPGVPSESSVRAALTHPNPAVRELAAKLLLKDKPTTGPVGGAGATSAPTTGSVSLSDQPMHRLTDQRTSST